MDGPYPTAGRSVDLGLWDLDPARLVMPLDAMFVGWPGYGLTDRRDASWRRRAGDPHSHASTPTTRSGMTTGHLGIEWRLQSRFEPGICGACSLAPICRLARGARSAG